MADQGLQRHAAGQAAKPSHAARLGGARARADQGRWVGGAASSCDAERLERLTKVPGPTAPLPDAVPSAGPQKREGLASHVARIGVLRIVGMISCLVV